MNTTCNNSENPSPQPVKNEINLTYHPNMNINCNSNENPFTQRVKNEIKSTYHPTMRRFIQTIALYEADRCLQDRYQALRPFQRKIALYDV